MGTVPVPSSNLCLGYLFFGQKETGAERVAVATPLRVSFCFFCDAHLWCQVSRTLLKGDTAAVVRSHMSGSIPLE